MAIHLKNEADTDCSTLLGAIHEDVAFMVLEIGEIMEEDVWP